MSVHGIEIEVGQLWRTRVGNYVKIAERMRTLSYPWKDGYGQRYWNNGRLEYSLQSDGDLISLVQNSSVGAPSIDTATHATALDRFFSSSYHSGIGPTKDSTAATTFGPVPANDAGVGDINSDAKGSGARFNTGKVPYELVPLELMAIHYEQLIMLGLPIDKTPCAPHEATQALLCLGQFQARRGDGVLVDALTELGDGWEDCARVFDYGRKKYKEFNWAKGMAWSIPIACAARHLQAIINGEHIDGDKVIDGKLIEGSNLPHRGHVYANICMLYTFMETYLEGDDRPPFGLLALNDDEVAL